MGFKPKKFVYRVILFKMIAGIWRRTGCFKVARVPTINVFYRSLRPRHLPGHPLGPESARQGPRADPGGGPASISDDDTRIMAQDWVFQGRWGIKNQSFLL